jgi:hypothetical protein
MTRTSCFVLKNGALTGFAPGGPCAGADQPADEHIIAAETYRLNNWLI